MTRPAPVETAQAFRVSSLMQRLMLTVPFRESWGDQRNILVHLWREGDGPFYLDVGVEGKPELLGYLKIDPEDGSVTFYDPGLDEGQELWPGPWVEDEAGDLRRAGLNRGRP